MLVNKSIPAVEQQGVTPTLSRRAVSKETTLPSIDEEQMLALNTVRQTHGRRGGSGEALGG